MKVIFQVVQLQDVNITHFYFQKNGIFFLKIKEVERHSGDMDYYNKKIIIVCLEELGKLKMIKLL